MNRTLILLLALVVIVGTFVGVTLYFKSAQTSTPTSVPTQPNTTPATVSETPPVTSQLGNNSIQAVQAAYQSAIASNKDNIKLYNTVISGAYALQVWKGTVSSGEGLLFYSSVKQRWNVISYGGGAWTVDDLVAKGVPQSTAQTLLAGLSQ